VSIRGFNFFSSCLRVFVVFLLFLSPLHARALTYEPGSDSPTRTLTDYIKNYVDVPKGATDWKVFGRTKEVSIEGKTKDGYDFQYYKPGFTPEVKALDGKTITMKGFMFPLDETEKQKLFLFGPFPVSCPFHYHVGPALVIEVHADKTPVKFSYDPVVLTGKLQLVDKDPENSTFYRLVDAKLVKP
jgi:hypothetical protein